MISKFKKMFTKDSKKDATWFATEAPASTRQEILEDIVEKSNKDQQDLVKEYRKKHSRA